MSEVFLIVSTKHTLPRHKYVTFWRPDHRGYCWPLSWAGHYDATEAAKAVGAPCPEPDSFAVPLSVALALSQPPESGYIDGDAGPVVPKAKMRALRAAAVSLPN
jgi:hypothetical protein